SDGTFTSGSVGIRASNSSTFDNFLGLKVVNINASLPFSDSFDQADASDLSSFWKEQTGTLTAQGNKASAGPLRTHTATANGLNPTDVTLQADVSLTGGATNSAGLVARYSGAAETTFYWAGVFYQGGQIYARIFKRVAGTDTPLATSTPLS